MSFKQALQGEKAKLQPIANPPEWTDAMRDEESTRAAWEQVKADVNISGTAKEERRLAYQTASQRVADLKGPKGRASARLEEIERLLSAERDAAIAQKELNRLNSALREARHTVAQFRKIEADLQAEIDVIEKRIRDDRRAHAAEEIKARVAGKPVPPPPKSLSILDDDLRSRGDALEAAVTARTDAEAEIESRAEEVKKTERSYELAARSLAELAYYNELLPVAMPIIARLRATRSGIGGYDAEFKIQIDRASLTAAAQQFREEIANA